MHLKQKLITEFQGLGMAEISLAWEGGLSTA